MKTCSHCGQFKNIDQFYKNCLTSDGLGSWCKDCERSRASERAEEHREWNKSPQGKAARDKYRSTQEFKKRVSDYQKDRRKKFPQKFRAREAVKTALKNGTLKKPDFCEKCGKNESLHGHHNDYSKKLEVIWLCKNCHGLEHRKW